MPTSAESNTGPAGAPGPGGSGRVRRQPPRFRRLAVARAEPLSPRLMRVTLSGPELEGLVVDQPAASVRLLLPAGGGADLVMPVWNGNEFRQPNGDRPPIRTFTPRRLDAGAGEIDLDIVLHGQGIASEWAARAEAGDPVALSGPGRGYLVDADADDFLLGGDESAVPAIGQLLEVLPPGRPVQVHIEIARADARIELPWHPAAAVTWTEAEVGRPPGDALVRAVETAAAALSPASQVWVAGEAAAVQRIRRHLFAERGWPRSRAVVRGYWKQGGDAVDEL